MCRNKITEGERRLCIRLGLNETSTALWIFLSKRRPDTANWFDLLSEQYIRVKGGRMCVYVEHLKEWKHVRSAVKRLDLLNDPHRYIRLSKK